MQLVVKVLHRTQLGYKMQKWEETDGPGSSRKYQFFNFSQNTHAAQFRNPKQAVICQRQLGIHCLGSACAHKSTTSDTPSCQNIVSLILIDELSVLNDINIIQAITESASDLVLLKWCYIQFCLQLKLHPTESITKDPNSTARNKVKTQDKHTNFNS